VKQTQLYAASLFFVLILGCTKDVGKVNLGNYPNDINNIMSGSCAVSGCHNAASSEAAAGLNLETWASMFRGAKSGSPVIPFSSRFSSLCYFVNTYDDLGLVNEPTMPLNRNALSREQVKRVMDWIDVGAPDKDGNIMWADDPKRKKLYAVNQGCDVVTVFDSQTQLPIRYIEVGSGNSTPHHLRISPDGEYWYVIFIKNNVMKKYRCSDDSFVGDIPLSPRAAGTGSDDAMDWNTFVISKDGKRAYAVSWTQNGSISALDLENLKLIGMYSGWYFPHAIALNAAEDKIYVGAQTGNYITEIDTSFDTYTNYVLEEAAESQLSSIDAHDMILSPDGKYFFITCQKSNDVRVFDLDQKKVVKIIPTAFLPQEIVYSKKIQTYYITCTGNGTSENNGAVTAINANSYNATILPCGAQPHGLAVDETKDLLYVLSRNISSGGPVPHHSSQCTGRNGFVNFVDLNTFKITSTRYELSVDPYFIYARP